MGCNPSLNTQTAALTELECVARFGRKGIATLLCKESVCCCKALVQLNHGNINAYIHVYMITSVASFSLRVEYLCLHIIMIVDNPLLINFRRWSKASLNYLD